MERIKDVLVATSAVLIMVMTLGISFVGFKAWVWLDQVKVVHNSQLWQQQIVNAIQENQIQLKRIEERFGNPFPEKENE